MKNYAIFTLICFLFLFGFVLTPKGSLAENFQEEVERFFGGNAPREFENEEDLMRYLMRDEEIEENDEEEHEVSDCFNYYEFQSIQINISPEKNSFVAGEKITFVGEIKNENPYPIFNGYLYARIAEKNPNYFEEGHNIVDEFFALGPIAVDTESSLPTSFTWEVPKNLKFGEYTIDYFFSVNKRMNLAGLPFTNEIIGSFSDFTISSNQEGKVYFLKESTKVNNEKYNHIGDWPFLNSGDEAIITQDIVNTANEDLETTISYALYFWDSLDPKDLISSETENIVLKSGERKTLTYKIPQIEESVYYLRIVAENENETKSIINIRVTSDVSKPRINYFGLNKFPIQEGDSATLYSCFHNTSYSPPPAGELVLVAKDKMGQEIARVDYEGIIPSEIFSHKTLFTANSDLEYLVLEQKLHDENGSMIEHQEIVYDLSLLRDDIEESMEVEEEVFTDYVIYIYIAIVIFTLLTILLIWFLLKPLFERKGVNNKISSLIILLAILLNFFLFSPQNSNAQSTIENFKKEQGLLVNETFHTTFTRRAVIQAHGFPNNSMTMLHLTPNVIDGGVSYRYNIGTTANRPLLAIGDKVDFTYNTKDFYYLSGAVYDTPHLGQRITIQGKSTLKMEAAKWVSGGDASIERICPYWEDGDFVAPSNCVGGTLNCESDFSHDWQHRGELDWYTEYLKMYSNDNLVQTFPSGGDYRPGYQKEPDIPQPLPTTSDDPNIIDCSEGICVAVGPGITTLRPSISSSYVILGYSCPIPIRNVEILFPGFNPTWEFEVVEEISPEIPLCGDFHGQEFPPDQGWPPIEPSSFCEQGELHEDYVPQPDPPPSEWRCVGSDNSEITCKAGVTEPKTDATCGTYDNRTYPGNVPNCEWIDGPAFQDPTWPQHCWDEHPDGEGTFCASGEPRPIEPDFPHPGSGTFWYCVNEETMDISDECFADRHMVEPWITTIGGLVHIEEDINLELRDLLYKNILGREVVSEYNKTAISSELLTSSKSLPLGGEEPTKELGWGEKIYTMGGYNKQINRPWYDMLLNRAQTRNPSGILWTEVTQEEELDLEKCKDEENHIYFIKTEKFEIDPSIYKDLANNEKDGCIFIVHQETEVAITQGDYESENKENVKYDIVRGFFLVDGTITIEDDEEGEALGFGKPKDGVKVVGGLFATGSEQSIKLNRNLGMYNLKNPALIVFYDIRYSNIAREVFGDIGYIRDIGFRE